MGDQTCFVRPGQVYCANMPTQYNTVQNNMHFLLKYISHTYSHQYL